MIAYILQLLFSFRAVRAAMVFILIAAGTQAQSTFVRTNAIGPNPFGSNLLVMNFDSANFPRPQAGTIFHLINQGAVNGRISFDTYNSGSTAGAIFQGRRSRGVASSPSHPLLNDVLVTLAADGYGDTGYHNISTGSFSIKAASSNWSQTSAPTKLTMSTTTEGSTALQERMVIDTNGKIKFNVYGAGLFQTDANGNATSAALTAGQVNTALGFTPANASTTASSASVASKQDTGTVYTKSQSDVRYLPKVDSVTYQTKYREDTARVNVYAALNGKASLAQATYTAGTGISITSNVITNTSTDALTFKAYGVGGLLSNAGKLFSDTISVSSATPTISLSSYLTAMGVSNFKIVSATGYRAGASATNAPQVAISAQTSNSVSAIITQQNTATVTLIGINVLSGLPMILVPDPVNVKVVLSFMAY